MIFCVEDDSNIRELVVYTLESTGFQARGFEDGSSFLEALALETPELVLLDIMLPGEDGMELLRKLKASKKTKDIPVIMVTAKGAEYDKVKGLDAGADEFIPKDRTPDVLIAHLKILRQKMIAHLNLPHVYELSPLTTFNAVARTLIIQGETILLGSGEARLLQLLCAKSNQISHMNYLMKGTWAEGFFGKRKRLKEYVSRIRKPLKKDPSIRIEYIGNDYEEGYILITTPFPAPALSSPVIRS